MIISNSFVSAVGVNPIGEGEDNLENLSVPVMGKRVNNYYRFLIFLFSHKIME